LKTSFHANLLPKLERESSFPFPIKINPLKCTFFTAVARPIAANVLAAWRQAGIHISMDES